MVDIKINVSEIQSNEAIKGVLEDNKITVDELAKLVKVDGALSFEAGSEYSSLTNCLESENISDITFSVVNGDDQNVELDGDEFTDSDPTKLNSLEDQLAFLSGAYEALSTGADAANEDQKKVAEEILDVISNGNDKDLEASNELKAFLSSAEEDDFKTIMHASRILDHNKGILTGDINDYDIASNALFKEIAATGVDAAENSLAVKMLNYYSELTIGTTRRSAEGFTHNNAVDLANKLQESEGGSLLKGLTNKDQLVEDFKEWLSESNTLLGTSDLANSDLIKNIVKSTVTNLQKYNDNTYGFTSVLDLEINTNIAALLNLEEEV